MQNKSAYIIGASHPTCGIIAIWKNTIAHVLYSISKGYLPIVDLQHFQNQYFKDGKTYKDNVWEYFFLQPCDVSLKDINDYKEIIISENKLYPDIKYAIFPDILPVENVSEQNFYKLPIIKQYKKYFKFSNEITEYLKYKYKKKLKGEENVLGILCRGTDYLNLRPFGHLIQPEPKIVMQKAKELYKKLNYKKIFLATEDKKIYEMFKKEFGNKLIENDQFMYSNTNKKYISEIKIKRKNHNYTLAKEYLSSIYILSKCKYFIGGRTAGTLAVYLLTDGFKYDYIWNLGKYGIKHPIYYGNFLQKIFSVKNEYFEDIKYKVITFLGLKIKIKQNTPQTLARVERERERERERESNNSE